ncbi:MAG: tRNA uridine-5-carboxymethylaminomethyl(34) synthesis enzyme MnmG [Magnetococcales bacterium]|nr:tRNA uridine-5-carboxymethylaminomethyl(34) synthesis enzyme MnmG [Magnetococcales bacterium]MBF0150615.1 tRNA uridine-5-carboxymethylaminomethyl(34) synthesis enzyme MnmG [Magnetococcales bacterium]
MNFGDFDIIVIGGGHAGIEAAHASARLGAKILLLTQNIDTIGALSCNPAVGGIGKGHMVREIDALGGIMALLADRSGIHFRLLNRRKGPAVRGPRAQMDKGWYRRRAQSELGKLPLLTLFQGEAARIALGRKGEVSGVVSTQGLIFNARAVILTTGTFLAGKAHIGHHQFESGRLGDPPSNALSQFLRSLGLDMMRLKTGTPPRLHAGSIDWRRTEPQEGDQEPELFSFMSDTPSLPQTRCHLTRTTAETARIIRDNIDQAPLFNGQIQGIGPRYCPSIEDKINKFPDREEHTIFLEPEGLESCEIYPNGISTSLPLEVQRAVVHSIPGLERAQFTRPGYAIEYDALNPLSLRPSLEVKGIDGLFTAGQINGTTGYEEAAAQGLMAGINAWQRINDREPVVMERKTSYIGVMIDDLVTRGVDEPYRMFTSRAEARILLRPDNADERLTPLGRRLGLVDDVRWQRFADKQEAIREARQRLETLSPRLAAGGGRKTGLQWLAVTDVDKEAILAEFGLEALPAEVRAFIVNDGHYGGYWEKVKESLNQDQRLDAVRIPRGMDWWQVAGLSTEVREKLKRIEPETLGQAERIPGITRAAISNLLVHFRLMQKKV